MKVAKKDLGKSQFELVVELSTEELQPYIEQGVKQVSREVKIDGFRPGKVPYDILKQKIGDMTIMEEAAHIAVHKTLDDILKQNIVQPIVGQPKIEITKLAPGNPLEFKIVAAVFPDVTLGEYKNLKIKARS
ncbi:MAG: trigger factor family protein, partial [Candidatus Falkowbacteria bacterium]|nr:trigger factor family protein [Candidatus Falkowbacteria bacterium]